MESGYKTAFMCYHQFEAQGGTEQHYQNQGYLPTLSLNTTYEEEPKKKVLKFLKLLPSPIYNRTKKICTG
jgi:hypothetical protein